MPVSDLAAIHIGLARFAGAVYPDDLEHVDAVLAACAEVRACVSWCCQLNTDRTNINPPSSVPTCHLRQCRFQPLLLHVTSHALHRKNHVIWVP